MLNIVSRAFDAYPCFRPTRAGPEKELVDWFLNQQLFRPRRGERVTVFREPKLPSGCPDLVAVVWKESIVAHWNRSRRDLLAADLRLMHYLTTMGPTSKGRLFPIFASGVDASLQRLQAANMVLYRKQRWRARALTSTFAATRIVAVEAKMTAWRAALDQAFLNTWFAPESYILIPSLPRRSPVLEAARKRGIGVLCKGAACWNVLPEAGAAPRSHVSWLLNEWAWKACHL